MVEQNIEVQQQLEKRLEEIWAGSVADDSRVSDVFGAPEDWQFRLGRFKLMLDPLERKWYYQGTFQEIWQPTGVGCGEAVFGAHQSHLACKRLAPSVKKDASIAQRPAVAVPHFCHECGGKLISGAKFCSFCGTAVPAQGGG